MNRAEPIEVTNRQDRIDWGRVQKLPADQQVPVVRGWVDAHQPTDVGYQAAQRWLLRRESTARAFERTRPAFERIGRELEACRTEREAGKTVVRPRLDTTATPTGAGQSRIEIVVEDP